MEVGTATASCPVWPGRVSLRSEGSRLQTEMNQRSTNQTLDGLCTAI